MSVDPVILSIVSNRRQPPGAMLGSDHHAQGDRGGGQHGLEAAGRDERSGVATVWVTPGRGADSAGQLV